MRFHGRMVEPTFTLDDFNVLRMKPHFQKVWIPVGRGFCGGKDTVVRLEKPAADVHGHIVEGAPADFASRDGTPWRDAPVDRLSRGHSLEWVNEGRNTDERWVYACSKPR